MYQIESIVMHVVSGVCQIKDIQEKSFTATEQQQYYVLQPVFEKGTTLFVPVENRPVRIRPLLTAAEIMEIIQNLSSSEITPWIPDDSQRLSYFKSVLKNGNQQELLQMLQTIHEQQEKKRHAGKKLKSVDERMKDSAKKLVEQECAYVLQIPLEEVGEWLQQQILQK